MSLRDFRHLRYSSRKGHAEWEHVSIGRDTATFCPTLQPLHMSCCVCPGFCAAEFGISGLTKLPCISVFAFITGVEFVCEAFRLYYKLREKHGRGNCLYLCVWAKLRASCLIFPTVFLQYSTFERTCNTVMKSPKHYWHFTV
jgi:hypothetical protein